MQRSALLAPAACTALLLTLAPAAHGQPQQPPAEPQPQPATAPGVETSDQLREKARVALAGGDVDGACGLFTRAYEAAVRDASAGAPPPTDVLFELASCHERQGKTAIAATEYDQVAAAPGPQADDARAHAAALWAQPPPVVASPLVAPPLVTPPPTAVGSGLLLGGSSPQKAPSTRIGDFMDTRLTWTFGDDDIVHPTGVALPASPNINIGDRKQYRLFFDNLNSRFGGRENLTHLALYKKLPGFIDRLDTEASLIVRLDLAALSKNTNNINQALYDSGSFIRAFFHTDATLEGKAGVGVTLWPLDTDRFRLGYLYDISWGGTNASINQSIFPRIVGSSPGAKIQYDSERFSVYAGFKTATIVEVQEVLTPGTNEVEEVRIGQTNYGFLAGGAVDITPYLHADLGAGYFQQGKFEFPDVAGEPIYTYGASARVVVHDEESPIPQSIDFLLYRNDPNKPQVIFKPETYAPGKTSWAVSLEGSNLFQNLKDFDVSGATKAQPARAAALQGVLKSGYTRASLTAIYRDLSFVMRNQPSYIPFLSHPDKAIIDDELFFAAAADYCFESAHLTPGVGVGLQLPATFNTKSVDAASSRIDRTLVVREQGNLSILPLNKGAVPIVQARVSLKWDVSGMLSAIVWAQYLRDNNGTFVERDPSEGTVALRTFVNPDFFGLGSSVQARF